MKILFLTNLYPPHYVGGYELVCAAVNNAMRERGHLTHVLTSNHQVKDGVAEEGVERSLWIHGYFGHPWLNIRQLRALEFHNNQTLRAAVGRFAPDLVHVFNLGGLSKSMIVTLDRLGVPTVFYVSDHWIARGLDADVWLTWWNRSNPSVGARLLRAAWTLSGCRKAWDQVAPTMAARSIHFRRLQFCSRFLRDHTAAAGFDVQHGRVIYNSIDPARFCGSIAPPEESLRRLLWVGRFADDKGPMTALKAMEALKGRFDGGLTLCGRGDPDYTDSLADFASQRNLPVTFLEAEAAQMPGIYRSHQALLFTSEWEEPFALTPLEAMACGLPVIGTTTGGSAEIFRAGENALTYPAGNAELLAQRILELAADPALRTRIAAAGQSDVRARFSEAAIMNQTEGFLLEAVRDWDQARLEE